MRNYKILLVFILILVLNGCGFNKQVEVVPNYFVIEVDSPDDLDICYKLNNEGYLGLLGGRLIGLYQKKDLLVAIKKPKFVMNDSMPEYYIIPVYKEGELDPSKGILGPLDSIELHKELQNLGTKLNQFKKFNLIQ
ncbi:hypothetical protein LZQ00_09250 [Sphingobacterium sp. SRCM116780]|uniref:hypothetical protein n=1 Tax=Sphingobacterium sp. SRCM116780 TaxID=2907623 RepID=UPI001F359057|nr:hypothetical protein [Sphingobacterium sp. SRCM116780]UIR57987.1 hypothetical protein LZQ00_09250 [Sphingobacterium sp. SRCM116780]